tara:strand:+ start:1693 stop:3078 length:1386 start_codon:yes stop_codon:yes gene_type:complete
MTKFKNLIGMEHYQFFSGTPKRRLEYINHLATEAADANDFMLTSREWIGVILSGEVGGSSTDRNESFYPNEFTTVDLGDGIPRIEMKIRIFDREVYEMGLLDPTLQLADPFEKGIPINEKQWRITLHPFAYTLYNAYEQQSFNFGDTVSLREAGGVFYVTKNLSKPWAGASTGAGDDIDFGDFRLTDKTRVLNGKNVRGSCPFTLQNFIDLAKTGVFEPLLNQIAKGESSGAAAAFGGNIYDVFNYGPIKRKYPAGKKGILIDGNTELSQLTIEQVLQVQKKRSKAVKGKYRLFASGKYQIVPGTLASAVEKILSVNTGLLYNAEVQEGFGVYLLLNKRTLLGKYLMGSDKVSIATAQYQVAREWASKRTLDQRTFTWSFKKDGVKTKFTQTCPKYCMCYGAGGNIYGYSGGNPTCGNGSNTQYTEKNKRAAMRLKAAIEKTRENFDASVQARFIRDSVCP